MTEFVPYGKEWKEQMNKMSKAELIEFLRKTIIEKHNRNTNCSLNSCAYLERKTCEGCEYLKIGE